MFGYVPWSVGWSLVPRAFPRMSCFLFFYLHCLQHYYVACVMSCSLFFLPALFAALLCGVRKMRKRPQPTHGQLARPVALDHRVHPAIDPTSELVIYAVSGPGKQPSLAASGSKPTTGVVDPSQGLRSASMRCLLLVLAAPCCCQCCCCCCCCCASAAVLLLLLLRRRLLLLFEVWSHFVLV